VAVSAVIANNVEHEAVRRNQTQAQTVAKLVGAERANAVKSAKLLWASMKGNARTNDILRRQAAPPADPPVVQAALQNLTAYVFTDGPLVYVTASSSGPGNAQVGRIVASVGIAPADAVVLVGSPVVREALTSGTEDPRGSAQVIGRLALSVGVAPVMEPDPAGGTRLVGAVVAATSLNRTWLEQRAPGTTLAIVARGQ